MLFGVRTETGLGNNADEIRTASELYQNLQVDPEQAVLNELFNEILAFNGLKKSLQIVKIEPVAEALSEQTVVSVMTKDEIRERIGLPPLEINQEVLMESQENNLIIDQLENTGFRASELEIISEHINPITSFSEAEQFEYDILKSYNFAINRTLNETEKLVLDIIKKNPKMPTIEISKALNVSIGKINDSIQTLVDANALDKNFIPTPPALDTIQLPQENIFIVYEYIKNPSQVKSKKQEIAPAIIPTTRPFCRELINLAKVRRYTLSQLKLLKNGQGETGINIFTKRGGAYTNPVTHETTPYCRHIWNQQLVRLKR